MGTSVEPSNVPTSAPACVALVGSPNVGKTSLFNRLTNLLAKTSNFSGTTVEVREATVAIGGQTIRLVDLPGLYSLDSTSPEEQVALNFLTGELDEFASPCGLVIVVDATHLERTLFLVGQAPQLGLPVVVAVNMIDLAGSQGIDVDCQSLSDELGYPVIPISARTGEGIEALGAAIGQLCAPQELAHLPVLGDQPCQSCSSCVFAEGYEWSSTVARANSRSSTRFSQGFTDTADQLLTHRLLGPASFALVMMAVFASIFWLAQFPMAFLDRGIGLLAESIGGWLPAGSLNDLITQGVVSGVGSVLIFLPQICILFLALAILEDCGYLSRAVLVVDRWMRIVGLPGRAFVPMLAAHACAIPAIMSTRVIANRRDRLVAIMVIPLMTCSARLPIYSMVAAMLFPRNAFYAALLFASAYALGMLAAFGMAFVLRVTLLPGEPASLIMDLPPYRVPSLRNALRLSFYRGWAFVRDAGTVILCVSIGIWMLSHFPKLDEAEFQQLARASTGDVHRLRNMESAERERLWIRLEHEQSLLGRVGKFIQPAFEPLGFDWKTSVGILASFAAREVVVSTMSVLYDDGQSPSSLLERVRNAKRPDGTPSFGVANSVSLLVFFVLAMQCFPTQVVTRRETGSWNWAIFQFVYMSLLAYGGAFLAKQACDLLL